MDPLVGITKSDVGKTVSIRHSALLIGDSLLPRNVKWGDAKHPDCTGTITSVEEKYLGAVQLDNGLKFGNPIKEYFPSMLRIKNRFLRSAPTAEFDECHFESSLVLTHSDVLVVFACDCGLVFCLGRLVFVPTC